MDEKRYLNRKPVRAKVRISHTKIGVIDAWTRDITDKGLFLELNPVPALPVGAHLRLQLLDSLSPDLAFNTRVVRVNKSGIGLVFVDFEHDGQRYPVGELKNYWKILTPKAPA